MHVTRLSAVLFMVALAACVGDVGGVAEDYGDLSEQGDPDPEDGSYATFASYSLPIGATVKVCHVYVGLNNRSGPSTKYMVLRVLPGGTRAKTLKRSGNWYRLVINGKYGWSYGQYLCKTSSTTSTTSTGSSPSPAGYGLSRNGIINISKAYVHYSYWWGGAAFPAPWNKPQSKPKGKCYSSTYSGHAGSYGADCSGFVGKAWRIPSALPFTSNRHPYSTWHFYNQSSYWSHISRGSARRADAMVYNSSKGGHIMIFESGSPWGQAWTYESRGCSYGVVHNLRTIGSYYRARRRKGV
jgi:uncharacterized protein YraI